MDIDHTLTGRGRGGLWRSNMIGERGRAGASDTAQAEIRFVVNLVLEEKA